MNDVENIYLQMTMAKSLAEGENGNWEFDVEASNENLDLEGQRVLRDALLAHKDYFLKEGVVSKDHKHRNIDENGKIDINEDYVIGEPKEVYVGDNGNVRVRGILYKSNPFAQKLAQLLKDGSTRIHASVGGLKPKVRQVIEGGRKIGEVASVLWDDLALTIAPVNPTLSPCTLVKSLSSVEFVREVLGKSMTAGSETDAAKLEGGGAIVKEDVDGEVKNVMSETPSKNDYKDDMRKAAFVAALIEMQNAGRPKFDDVRDCACRYGVSCEEAEQILKNILEGGDGFIFDNDGGQQMAKSAKAEKKGWDEVEEALKKSQQELETIEDSGDDEVDDIEADDIEIEGATGDDGEDEDAVEETANADYEALNKRIDGLEKSIAECVKACKGLPAMQKSLTDGILLCMESIKKPAERKAATGGAVMEKSLVGKARHKQFSAKTKEAAMEILHKSLAAGDINEVDFVVAEGQINKSINDANFQIDGRFVDILKNA